MKWDEKYYYVYILASKKNGTLYIGVTNNLIQRVLDHRLKTKPGFAEKYNVNLLVHYETFKYIKDAIFREKQLKKWNRIWKIRLIEKENKEWKDLLNDILEEEQIDAYTKAIKEKNMDSR
jgi:putative endonuclease